MILGPNSLTLLATIVVGVSASGTFEDLKPLPEKLHLKFYSPNKWFVEQQVAVDAAHRVRDGISPLQAPPEEWLQDLKRNAALKDKQMRPWFEPYAGIFVLEFGEAHRAPAGPTAVARWVLDGVAVEPVLQGSDRSSPPKRPVYPIGKVIEMIPKEDGYVLQLVTHETPTESQELTTALLKGSNDRPIVLEGRERDDKLFTVQSVEAAAVVPKAKPRPKEKQQPPVQNSPPSKRELDKSSCLPPWFDWKWKTGCAAVALVVVALLCCCSSDEKPTEGEGENADVEQPPPAPKQNE